MATHDYVIANASGAAFRTDLNNALAAIVSNNSNSSEPATMYAYQWWADTTNAVMKIRNSANNAWIELFQLDGTLTLEDGSASTPALAFRDDLNTGIFSSAADTFNVATGGVERMELGAATVFNEDGADVDFRIEGDNAANLFYVDAGNDRIGIGTSSPDALVDIIDSVNDTRALIVRNVNNSGGSAHAKIEISGGDNATAILKLECNGQNHEILEDGSGNLRIEDNDSEKLRIDSSGNLGLGTSSPDTLLHLAGGSPNVKLHNTGTSASANDVFGSIIFQHSDSDDAGITAKIECVAEDTAGNSRLAFHNGDGGNADERMRIDSAGKIFIATTTRGVDASASNLAVYGNSSTTTGNVAGSFFGGAVSSARHVIVFSNSTGVVGSIATNGTQTEYNTTSDYRLKENTVAISDGITRLKTLKPIRFNFIKDASTTIDGFLAHEVSDAIPAAVTGEKDGMAGETYYEEGDELPSGKEYGDVKTYSTTQIEPQLLDHSKIVPLLTAALQEAITKIETLETKVAALETA